MTPDDHIYLQSVARKYGVYVSRPGNGICHTVHVVKLYDGGVYLVNGVEIVPEAESAKVQALTGKAADKAEAKKGTMAY